MTTCASLETQKEAIQWHQLSRTFQDAMSLTRALGFDCIWIDSLCIIQDSVDDWVHEEAHMGDIYQHAVLTIGASGAENGDQSLFSRHWARVVRQTYRGWPTGLSATSITAHEAFDERDFLILSCKLLSPRTRGWCLQEELLSTRFVHSHVMRCNGFVTRESAVNADSSFSSLICRDCARRCWQWQATTEVKPEGRCWGTTDLDN